MKSACRPAGGVLNEYQMEETFFRRSGCSLGVPFVEAEAIAQAKFNGAIGARRFSTPAVRLLWSQARQARGGLASPWRWISRPRPRTSSALLLLADGRAFDCAKLVQHPMQTFESKEDSTCNAGGINSQREQRGHGRDSETSHVDFRMNRVTEFNRIMIESAF